MTETNCPKCGEELLMYDGYGVCNNCGEIYGYNIEEKAEEDIPEEAMEEIVEDAPASEEFDKYITWEEIIKATSGEIETEEEVEPEAEAEPETVEIPTEAAEPDEEPAVEAVAEPEVVPEAMPEPEVEIEAQPEAVPEAETEATESEKEAEDEEKDEEIPPVAVRNVQKKKKKKKAGITSVIILLLLVCALWAFIGYLWFTPQKAEEPKEDTKQEDVIEEIAEEEPLAEETEETEESEESEVSDDEVAKEPEKTPEPAPVVKEEPKKEAPAQRPGGIAYKIRKSAGDASTQKGAFADLNKAKAYADGLAEEGYKVFDLDGNLVYDPAA